MTEKPLQPVKIPLDGDTGKDLQKRIRVGESLLMGGLKVPEPYKEIDENNAIKIVFGTSGEYPDGTKWERDATPEEKAQYDSWCK